MRSCLGPDAPSKFNRGPRSDQLSNQKDAFSPLPSSQRMRSARRGFSWRRPRTWREKRFTSWVCQYPLLPNICEFSQATQREPALEKKFQICFNLKTFSKSSRSRIPKPPSSFGLQTSVQATLAPQAPNRPYQMLCVCPPSTYCF